MPRCLLTVNRHFGGTCRLHPSTVSIACYLLSRWFLARLILPFWRWKWHVPPKHQLTFNGLHGIIYNNLLSYWRLTVPKFEICQQILLQVSIITLADNLSHGSQVVTCAQNTERPESSSFTDCRSYMTSEIPLPIPVNVEEIRATGTAAPFPCSLPGQAPVGNQSYLGTGETNELHADAPVCPRDMTSHNHCRQPVKCRNGNLQCLEFILPPATARDIACRPFRPHKITVTIMRSEVA
jgi:hypothetical protein